MLLARHAALALALLGTTAAAAVADVTIVRKESGPGNRSSTSRIQLAERAVRIDGEDTILIYRKDLDTAWMVRGDSYMELDKAAAQAVKKRVDSQMGDVQRQMDQALAQVPADKRAMVEQMMHNGAVPGAVPGAPQAPAAKLRQPTFTATSDGTVGAWSCTTYDGRVDGAVVERVCAARLEQVGLTEADVAIMYDAAKFFSEIGAEMGGKAATPPSDALGVAAEQGFPGYALSRKRLANGTVESESTVTEVTRGDLDPALFAKPNLKRIEFGTPMH